MSEQSTAFGHGKRISGPDERDMKPKEASKVPSDGETISQSSDAMETKEIGKFFIFSTLI